MPILGDITPLPTVDRIRGLVNGGTLPQLGTPDIRAIVEYLRGARDEIDCMLIHAERAHRLASAREMGAALRGAAGCSRETTREEMG